MKQWKHKIQIKHLFEDDTTPELIVKICLELKRQLEKINQKYETSEEGDYIFYELEAIIDNFDFLRQLANGTIPQSEWKDYSFDGDFEETFNGYLSELYDLADQDKLIWIG